MRSYFNLAAELYLVKYILFKLKHFEKNVQVPNLTLLLRTWTFFLQNASN